MRALDPGRALAIFIVLCSGIAGAGERFDHRGAVGLLIGSGLEHKSAGTVDAQPDHGFRLLGDLGLTLPIGVDGNELAFFGRGELGGPRIDLSLAGGYRGYFAADERVKTFLDLQLTAHMSPGFTVGPRIGFGGQYEISQVAGIYAALGAQLGFGTTLRFGVELVLGLQLRSYLLE